MVKVEQTHDFFHSVVKYGSDLVTIIDQEGLYKYVSDSVTRLLGYTEQELIGNSPFEHIHADDLSVVLSYYHTLAHTDQHRPPPFRYRHKNGTWRWLDCTATNMLSNPSINGFVTNSRDITEKVVARQRQEESKAYYEALYFNHPDLVLTLNRDGIIQDCNASVIRVTGYNTQEVIDKPFSEFISEPFHYLTQNGFLKALGGEAHTLETRIISKEQHPVDLNVTLVPVVLNSNIVAIQCIAIDITEKKQAEQQLNEQTKQLNNILGSITEAFFALDNKFCFTYLNTAFKDYIKLDASALRGKNIWELFPAMKGTNFYEKCVEVSRTGLPVECEEFIEHIGSAIYWRIYAFENGIAVCFTDVSAKKKELEEQKNLSFVASKTTNGVLITDNEGKIEWVNNSFEILTGFSLDEISGKDPADFLYGPETQGDQISHIRHMINRKLPFSAEFINYKKTGEQIWIALDITPILDENGELMKFINMYTDITDRKQAEIRLLQLSDNLFKQNRDLQQFTYIVSHNLRAPVANVVGLTKMLQKLDTNSIQYKTALKNLERSAESLDTVIKDLNKILAVKKEGQDGIPETETEFVNIPQLLKEVVQSLQDMLSTANAKVDLILTSDIILESKRAYIYSIIHNLLTNAIKYRSAERNLLISLESVEEDNHFVIKVKDNGTGMDMEKVGPHLFKLYKRFHSHIEGKGLGLYLVKSQIEALDGQIEVNSALGIGTEFKILFKNSKYD